MVIQQARLWLFKLDENDGLVELVHAQNPDKADRFTEYRECHRCWADGHWDLFPRWFKRPKLAENFQQIEDCNGTPAWSLRLLHAIVCEALYANGGIAALVEVHSKRQVRLGIEQVRNMMKFGYTIVYVPDVLASVEFFERALCIRWRFVHESGYADM